MLARFRTLPPSWRRDAEVSFSQHDPQRLGFQTRLETAAELQAFLQEMGLDPGPFLAADEQVRDRFLVSPFRWAKVGFRGLEAVDASQYWLVDPAAHYPITTLRVFARRFGTGPSPALEEVLRPALEDRSTRWGLALKPGAGARRASGFCSLPNSCLGAVLDRLAGEGLLPREQAAHLGSFVAGCKGRPEPFLTVDLADPSSLAVDVEDPACLEPVGEWLASLADGPPRYLKCRPAGAELHWTAYFPWLELAPRHSREESLSSIRDYYERTHEDYLECVGPTFQAALVAQTPEASNRLLAERAGLEAGMRVLDVGCGVCGPALDLAAALDVSIDGITLSPSQAATARDRIQAASLEDRVRVHLGDYHHLPFEDGSFDAALLLEAASYSPDPEGLFAEVHRVLRPGALLYVKDFFLEEGRLGPEQARELQDYDFTYCTRTRPLREVLQALDAAGFECLRAGPLAGATMERFHQAMVDSGSLPTVTSAFLTFQAPAPRLSRFGRYHRRSWNHLPVEAGDLLARRN